MTNDMIARAKILAYRALHPRVRTTDSKRIEHMDSVISVATAGELQAIMLPRQRQMLGRNFDGTLQSVLTAIQNSPKLLQALMDNAAADEASRGALGKGPASSRSTAPDPGPRDMTPADRVMWDTERNTGEPYSAPESDVSKMQRMNDAKYAPARAAARDAMATVTAGLQTGSPAHTAALQKEFWKSQPTVATKKWGAR